MGETAHCHFTSPVLDSIREARNWVEASCRAWEPESTCDALLLVTSELMTNALVHGRGSVSLKMTYTDGHVRIEVSDEGNAPVALASFTPETTHGRGLHTVAGLSRDWGSTNHGGTGNTVWADVRLKKKPLSQENSKRLFG